MLLFYMLIAFPMLVVCGVLAIEYQRVLTANRVSYQVADAAAAAGTLQLVPLDGVDESTYNQLGCTDPSLWSMCLYDATKGVTVTDPSTGQAMETVQDVVAAVKTAYADALKNGEGARLSTVVSVEVVSVTQASRDAGGKFTPATVKVSVKYKAPTMGFLALGRLIGASVSTDTVYEVRSSGYVCSPGESGSTANGECVR